MLDGLFDLIASTLNFFYELVPNYAVAIALLTLVVMLITTPLTMKSTRSMIEMQRLQPEIRKLQQQYKDDRQKLNEEMMRFYKEHQINPLGGCLPILIQAPIFSILFWVVRGLTSTAKFEGLQREAQNYGIDPQVTGNDAFRPKYLNPSDELYQSLLGQEEMRSFGVDLAISPLQALEENFLTALPYVAVVVVIGVLSWYQTKQIMGRNKGVEVTQQQKLMGRIGPTMFVAIAIAMPLALGVYFLISTTWRVGQQAYITHTLYRGEDSIGAQAQRAAAEARAQREKDQAGKGRSNGAAKKNGKQQDAKDGAGKASGNGTSSKSGQSRKATGTGAGAKAKPHPRSRNPRPIEYPESSRTVHPLGGWFPEQIPQMV
jgi:YidC/Oxa1 family membrane protein insertase